MSDKSAADLVAADLSAHGSSPEHILAAGRALKVSGASDADVAAVLARLAADGLPPSVAAMESALTLVSDNERETLRAAYRKRSPLAFVLATPEEKAERAKANETAPTAEGKTDV